MNGRSDGRTNGKGRVKLFAKRKTATKMDCWAGPGIDLNAGGNRIGIVSPFYKSLVFPVGNSGLGSFPESKMPNPTVDALDDQNTDTEETHTTGLPASVPPETANELVEHPSVSTADPTSGEQAALLTSGESGQRKPEETEGGGVADERNPSSLIQRMLNPMKKSKELMTRAATNQLVTFRMKGSRPEAWEEDISRNTLDTEPFSNLPSPSERQPANFEIPPHRIKSLQQYLDGRSIESDVARDTYPIPCPPDREGYSPGRDELYWLSGYEDFLKIMSVVKKYSVYPRSVLDFGCASGRVIRHFAAQTEIPEIWGTDINRRHIRWLYEFMPPQVQPVFNHCIPSHPDSGQLG